jgi:hypothetical protein
METRTVPLGSRLGPYRLIKPLGRGGYGAVYLAEDTDGGDFVAVKVHWQDGGAAFRFRQEYLILNWLDHPGVPRAWRLGRTYDDVAWLSMEHVEGAPARRDVERHGAPGSNTRTARAVGVITRLLDTLTYLHGQGVLHCDLKSDNVLVQPDGRVKVVDFGAAQIVEASTRRAGPAPFTGTRGHAPLEQLIGYPLDARTDLFAVGVLAYQLLSGRPAYEKLRTASGSRTAEVRALFEPRPTLAELIPGLPDPLCAWVESLLAPAPADRPSSAADVRNALASFDLGDTPKEHVAPRRGARERARPLATSEQLDAAAGNALGAARAAFGEGRLSEAARGAEHAARAASTWELRAAARLEQARVAQWLFQMGAARQALEEVDAIDAPALRVAAGLLRAELDVHRGERAAARQRLEQLRVESDAPLVCAALGALVSAATADDPALPDAHGADLTARALADLHDLRPDHRFRAYLCHARALDADPILVAAPLASWLRTPAARLARLTWHWAALRWAIRRGQATREETERRAARALADSVELLLDPKDRAGWQMHREVVGL